MEVADIPNEYQEAWKQGPEEERYKTPPTFKKAAKQRDLVNLHGARIETRRAQYLWNKEKSGLGFGG